MNLKKTFITELITGIVLVLLFNLVITKMPVMWNNASSFIFLVFYFIYNQILYRKQKNCSDIEKQILKKAGLINGIIIGIPLFILLMNFKNPQPDYIKQFFHYFGYYVVVVVLFVHSLSGLAILKYYERKK